MEVTPEEKRRLWGLYTDTHRPLKQEEALVLTPVDVWGPLFEATEAAMEMVYDSFKGTKVYRRVANIRFADFGKSAGK